MSSLPKPKQRISFTDVERQRLRGYDQDHPSLTRHQLASWFKTEFGRRVSNSSICDMLSDKYAYLDTAEASDTTRRNRGPQWVELEDSLFKWWQEVQPCDVSGKELRLKANEIWQTLPVCKGRKSPSFSDGWLTNWRIRRGVGQPARSANADQVKQREGGPQQVQCVSMVATHISGQFLA
jgi:hypothetical protein